MEIQSPLEFFARSPRTWSSTYPPNDADQGGCRRHLQEAFQLAFGSLSKCHRLIEKQRSKHREPFMKIVVIGGSGFIGSKLVPGLGQRGHDAVAASPNSGVNSVTGEGLAEVLKGASMVVDVSNAPSWEASAVLNFFETSTRSLLKYGAEAGIKHFAALSVVGTQTPIRKRVLPREDRSGEADQKCNDSLFHRSGDAVLRIPQGHCPFFHAG